MGTFNEADVNRRAGKFDFKNHAPSGVVLNPGGGGAPRFVNARDLFNAELGGAPVVEMEPATKTEARRLLRNLRGEADGAVRKVNLNHHNEPDSSGSKRVEVTGPTDGRPIAVDLQSGIPGLLVTAGKAVIRADSRSGNSINVAEGAEAVIVADPGSKVTVEVAAGGKATLVSTATKNWFRPYGDGDIQVKFGPDAEPEPYVRPVFEGY